MATLNKVTLSGRELSELRKMRDNYTAEINVQNEKLKKKLDQFWADLRAEHDMEDDPFHLMDDCLWVLRDATQEEQEAYVKMVKYK